MDAKLHDLDCGNIVFCQFSKAETIFPRIRFSAWFQVKPGHKRKFAQELKGRRDAMVLLVCSEGGWRAVTVATQASCDWSSGLLVRGSNWAHSSTSYPHPADILLSSLNPGPGTCKLILQATWIIWSRGGNTRHSSSLPFQVLTKL